MNLPDTHSYIEENILLVHKPKGITSFDVIRKLRPFLNEKKIGHAGTLDPLAHGLMIVGIGQGTKKLDTYLKLPKTYIADIFLGTSTTTGDMEGEVVDTAKIYPKDITEYAIDEALRGMIGRQRFTVPRYSAIKVDGKPLYWYARNNQEPPRIPVKEMVVTNAVLLDHYASDKGYILRVRFEVGSGAYIRTLGEELGKRLGHPATLRDLYRVRIGEYLDSEAYRFES